MTITIIRDTREKEGKWDFAKFKGIDSIVDQCLPTGDYTIKGFEDQFVIERKKSISELAINISEPRFKKELNRLVEFKYKYLVLEFDIKAVVDWPYNAGIPRWKIPQIRITPQYIMKFLSDIHVNYGIPVLFCGNRTNAQYFSANIMRRIGEKDERK